MSCTYNEDNNVWSAVHEEPIFNHNNSLGQILHHHLLNFSKKVLQIDDASNTAVTGEVALTWATRIAQKLNQQQLDHTDVVGIAARNSTYVLPVALGCFFNGTPLHSVNPNLDKDTISHCFGLTKPKIVFCDGADYAKVFAATSSFETKIYTITGHRTDIPTVLDLLKSTGTEETYEPEKLVTGMHQTVAILCSSGTTGKPKAVCMSAPTLLFKDWMNANDSILYTASGIDWVTGLYFLISGCINGFTRIIFSRNFDVENFMEMVRKYKISTAFLSSRYVAALLQHPQATRENLLSLRSISFGGSALSEASTKKLAILCGNDMDLYFCYGITEVGLLAINKDNTKPKSVGQLKYNLALRIVDDNDHNLSHHEIGEIVVKTPRKWMGYYGNPTETERAKDDQGWFRTGDMGYMDADNDLHIVDRKKEVLKFQGIHFWPSAIEEVVAELSDVRDVCVVSVFDDTKGDLAGALVVRKNGCSITAQDIINHVKKRLVAPHMQLNAGVYFVDNLPQNLNGKVLKNDAKELLKKFAITNNVSQGCGLQSS